MAESAQGHCRVHWGGGDKRTIVKLPSGNRRGDITLLGLGGLLLFDVTNEEPLTWVEKCVMSPRRLPGGNFTIVRLSPPPQWTRQ